MAGGAAEPESLLPGGGLEPPPLWHLFFPGCWSGAPFPARPCSTVILHLPLVLPPVVVGYLLLAAMGRRGFIGSWLYDWFGISFAFSWRGAVLAAAVMSFPADGARHSPGAGRVDVKLEQAARTSGPAAGGYF